MITEMASEIGRMKRTLAALIKKLGPVNPK